MTGETQRRADEEIQEMEERGERDEGEEGEEEERNGGEHPNKSNEGDSTVEEEAEAVEGMEHDGQVKSSDIFTRETVILLMVTSLLMRAHSEEDLERCTKGVVTLLERLSLLTELVGHREELQGLLEEANQVRTQLFASWCA